MASAATQRIVTGLRGSIELERDLERLARVLAPRTRADADAEALRAETELSAGQHIAATALRLSAIGGPDAASEVHRSDARRADVEAVRHDDTPSLALSMLLPALQRAVACYALLQPLTHRLRESWVSAPEGTGAHLAREFTQGYVSLMGRIHALLPELVLRELDSEGVFCGCTCPACHFGICLCATSARAISSKAWSAAQSGAFDPAIAVPPPRVGSAADVAGLLPGDLIVAADGTRIDAMPTLQRAIREHEPGDRIRLKVRRDGRELLLLADVPRGPLLENEDDCLLPAGQAFELDSARSVHQRVAASANGRGTEAATLASLTPREIQVLRMAAEGATNPRIADQLEISRATVARHIANILGKLGVSNRAEAASLAAANGLLGGR